jgi:oligopeptide transport system ATP-binding protein
VSGEKNRIDGDPNSSLLAVSGLTVYFPLTTGIVFKRRLGTVRAVDDIDFLIDRGEILGLVGESGCGKSTTGRAVLRLLEPTSGSVRFDGVELTALSREAMRRERRKMQMIFQDPFASLNPRMKVGEIIAEPLEVHRLARGAQKKARIQELLEMVGLKAAFSERYPHQFSGGQRQRIGIARALAVEPKFIVADEPISSLDVSISAQILNLLKDLQEQLGLTYLFIAHDLSVVNHFADRVAVMYLGKIVELAKRDDLYLRPHHPYTRALLSAVPVPDPVEERKRERITLGTDVPSAVNPPSGCRFRTRCWKAQPLCSQEEPQLLAHSPGHLAACHFPE